MKDTIKSPYVIIGFREWVSLPGLGIDAIKAKIDTGAKTSSLHAFDINLVKKKGRTYVRFKVHPLQNELNIEVDCEALLVEKRIVTDSGGHKEERYVIETTLFMGPMKKKVEFTLTNRESMKYRMLIGRTALEHFYIDPCQSYLLGKTIKQKKFLKEVRTSVDRDV
jgi:hypothetical protein